MKRKLLLLVLSIVLVALTACGSNASPVQNSAGGAATGEAGVVIPNTGGTAAPESCEPTAPDMLGPFYKPDAPLRDQVGEGYVLSGVVRSAAGCQPIPNATIEFWMAGPDGVYRDEYRATLIAGENGEYRFQSHFPPPYAGRPSHIHVRVSVSGYETLVTQHYPEQGQTEAVIDLVLEGA